MASRYGDEFRGRGRDRSRDRGYVGGSGTSDRGYSSRSSGGGYGRDRMGGRRGEQSGGGAEHLARIHGTEEDRVNCPFYFKIGACRHGDRCSRLHNKPVFSQTILVSHMYQNPIAQVIAQNGDPTSLDQRKVDEEFEDFYEEIFEELCKFGKLEELNICDNLGDHLVGNVYAKYDDEEHAAAAQKALYGRFYAGRPLVCEFSPVTDFREARCRQFDEGTCNRGGYCNFMHIKTVPRAMQRELERTFNRGRRDKSRSRSRSRSRSGSPGRGRHPRGHSRSRSRDGESLRRKRSRSPSLAKKTRRSRSRSHSPRSPGHDSRRGSSKLEEGIVDKKHDEEVVTNTPAPTEKPKKKKKLEESTSTPQPASNSTVKEKKIGGKTNEGVFDGSSEGTAEIDKIDLRNEDGWVSVYDDPPLLVIKASLYAFISYNDSEVCDTFNMTMNAVEQKEEENGLFSYHVVAYINCTKNGEDETQGRFVLNFIPEGKRLLLTECGHREEGEIVNWLRIQEEVPQCMTPKQRKDFLAQPMKHIHATNGTVDIDAVQTDFLSRLEELDGEEVALAGSATIALIAVIVVLVVFVMRKRKAKKDLERIIAGAKAEHEVEDDDMQIEAEEKATKERKGLMDNSKAKNDDPDMEEGSFVNSPAVRV